MLATSPAHAEIWFGGDAPLAVAISDGQRGIFRPGLLPAGAGYLGLGPLAAGLRVRAGFMRDGAPPASDREDPGTGGLVSATLAARVRLAGAWVEVAGGGAVTGTTLAPTFELGAGLSIQNDTLAMGPSLRYVQVRSTDAMDVFGTAELLLVGLDVRFGGRPTPPRRSRPAVEVARPPASAPPEVAPPAAPAVAIERDEPPLVDRDASCAHDLAACPVPAGVEVLADRFVLDDRVLFDTDRARVRSAGRQLVRAIVELWRAHPAWTHVTIEGHADVRGGDDYNVALSELRAQRVRALMIELGADASALDAVGLGKSRPRDPGHDEHAHQRNRRVEFVIDRSAP